MHILFRSIGQQQGMQAIRAILSEDIDAFINNAIMEKCRSVAIVNTSTAFPDRVSVQNNFISPINALRTLVKNAEINLSLLNTANTYNIPLDIENVMLFTSFNIIYKNNDVEIECRFIENDKLTKTLRDYCNSASWDYPIIAINNGSPITAKLITNSKTKAPNKLIVNYIKNPAKVSLSQNVDCDLPEYLHNEIVQLAVNSFFQTVGATTQNITKYN